MKGYGLPKLALPWMNQLWEEASTDCRCLSRHRRAWGSTSFLKEPQAIVEYRMPGLTRLVPTSGAPRIRFRHLPQPVRSHKRRTPRSPSAVLARRPRKISRGPPTLGRLRSDLASQNPSCAFGFPGKTKTHSIGPSSVCDCLFLHSFLDSNVRGI